MRNDSLRKILKAKKKRKYIQRTRNIRINNGLSCSKIGAIPTKKKTPLQQVKIWNY